MEHLATPSLSRVSSALAALAASCAMLACAATNSHSETHGCAGAVHPHWTYSGSTGPSSWGSLDAEYFAADKGSSQSPIDIQSARAVQARMPALELATAASPLRVLNNGHTVQVNCAPGNSLRFADQQYALQQFHFHSPSEHTLDGQHAAIEMHLVHKSADGHAAVVSVMIHPGAANAAFDALWQNLPTQECEERAVAGVSIDPGALLPADRSYYWYDGSLTTPPCTEGVRWFVLATPIEMSGEQIARFREAYDGNNRPVQPHNARLVLRAL